MKIAVTSTGPALDDNVEARFGRCAYFLIIDTETLKCEPIENPNIALGGGAGIQSAQLMSEKGVTTVLTGNCGPNAFNVFGQAGIQVIVGVRGTVRNAVEQFKTGALSTASGPNVVSHFGMGGGSGMGGGMGCGGGMGRGRGMGIGTPMGMPWTGSLEGYPQGTGMQINPEQELSALKQQVELLEQQRQQLNQRIIQLEGGHKAVAVVDSEKCTGCGICVDVCPTGAIEVNQQAEVNEESCNGCAACVSECPNEAIVIVRKKVG
jgi:predicted Fe-Mo cluster-binding NifX family protein/ferredoxin